MSPDLKDLLVKTSLFVAGLFSAILFCFCLMSLLTVISEPYAYLLPIKLLWVAGAIVFLACTANCFKAVIKKD